MKKTMIAIAALCLLNACSQVAGWNKSKNDDSTQVNADSSMNMAIVRDESINESNAYSDLFLDSTSINSYIKQKGIPDSTANLIRNFYALRNNGFAWFSTSGLTEQARGLWGLSGSRSDTASSKKDRRLSEKMDTLLQSDSIQV